jgi:two-component system, LuxR family, sensor kinase FixL
VEHGRILHIANGCAVGILVSAAAGGAGTSARCSETPAIILSMSLNWVLIVWSMAGSASLTLAAIHCLAWLKNRAEWANLLFSVAAIGAVAVAGCELRMMAADTPIEFATGVRWAQVAVWVVILSLTGFVLLYLRSGRIWLAWVICGLRTCSLVLNFLVGQNLNYLQIDRLRHIRFLGQSVALAEGTPNPAMLVGQLSLVLLMVFVADAAIAAWRRGDRRLALVTGGSILSCIFGASLQAALIILGFVDWPLTPSLFFVAIVVAMSYETSRGVFRAAQLAAHLEKSEAALRLSEWRYDQASEAAGIGSWEWNVDRDEIWATDRARSLLGMPAGQRVDLARVWAAIHPEDREAVRQSFMHSLDAGGTYQGECRVLSQSSEVRWLATRCRTEVEARGRPITVRGISFDVTERVKAAEEIVRQRGELAHVVRLSTLNELSVSIGHEINQPLQSIRSNAQAGLLHLANEHPDLAEVREILEDIVSDDRRAGEVIREFRSLLKKDEDRLESLDFNDIVRSVLSLLNSEMAIAGVVVKVTLAPDLPLIKGHPIQLKQVLINLIINGCEAMVSLSRASRGLILTTRSLDGQSVLACVEDRGAGIPPQNLERVFNPFFTTKTQGLGLGLSVSRLIITGHGGRLWAAASGTGPGASFCFTLPAVSNVLESGSRR